jgi:hypothetical protein
MRFFVLKGVTNKQHSESHKSNVLCKSQIDDGISRPKTWSSQCDNY